MSCHAQMVLMMLIRASFLTLCFVFPINVFAHQRALQHDDPGIPLQGSHSLFCTCSIELDVSLHGLHRVRV